MTAPSVRRVIVRTSTQEPTTRDGTAGGLEGVEEEKEVWGHGKKRREEGTGRWSLPLDEASMGVFIHFANKYARTKRVKVSYEGRRVRVTRSTRKM